MKLYENCPKCIQTHFMQKTMHNFCRGKSSHKIWAISVIYTKLPKWPNSQKFAQSGHSALGCHPRALCALVTQNVW
jgi:hypothetical protein